MLFWPQPGRRSRRPRDRRGAATRRIADAGDVATLAELRRQRLITPLGRDEQLLLTIEELRADQTATL